MIAYIFFFFSTVFALSASHSVQKYVNSCGIVYSTSSYSHHDIKRAIHGMTPRVAVLLDMLKASHHKLMEEYGYRKTWIPDESSLISTKSTVNVAKQLPDIYKNLLTFSYALDLVYEDTISQENNVICFFFIDTLPSIIDKHRELVCATDLAMSKLNIEIPEISIINLPVDWVQPQGSSCVDKFFRFSETHSKYRKFLTALKYLLHI